MPILCFLKVHLGSQHRWHCGQWYFQYEQPAPGTEIMVDNRGLALTAIIGRTVAKLKTFTIEVHVHWSEGFHFIRQHRNESLSWDNSSIRKGNGIYVVAKRGRRIMWKRKCNKVKTCPSDPIPFLRCSTISKGVIGFVSCMPIAYQNCRTSQVLNLNHLQFFVIY